METDDLDDFTGISLEDGLLGVDQWVSDISSKVEEALQILALIHEEFPGKAALVEKLTEAWELCTSEVDVSL